MSATVSALLDRLTNSPDLTVRSAGEAMVSLISAGGVTLKEFVNDPQTLTKGAGGLSRYLAQIAWRAVHDEYRDVDEIVAGLEGVVDRDPPQLSLGQPDGIAIPEARVLKIHPAVPTPDGGWRLGFEALVTSGELQNEQVFIAAASRDASRFFETIALLWVHASVAVYNLRPERVGERTLTATARSLMVIEPLHQVNATAIATGLLCPKPFVDRLRRGRGDVTLPTLKGMIVHGIWDRLVEGGTDLDEAYRRTLPGFLTDLAAVAGEGFDEAAFRDDVLRHGEALLRFIDRNPHVVEDGQVEVARYSATLGIQGRIDAVFRGPDRLDVVELKTGKRIRDTDHAQLAIYRLLLTDFVREEEAAGPGASIRVTARLLSSADGSTTPVAPLAGFGEVLDARNRLAAYSHALGRGRTHLALPYAGYDQDVCRRCPSWTARDCRRDSGLFGDDPGSGPGSAALEYVRRMTRAVQRERWRAERELSELLDDGRLAHRLQQSRSIVGAKCIGAEAGVFAFAFDENASDLGPRDRVLVHAGAISRSPAFQGHVREMGPRRARIAFSVGRLTEETFSGREWILDRLGSDPSSGPSQAGLYDFLRCEDDARQRIVLGEFSGPTPPLDAGSPMTPTRRSGNGFNSSQEDAVESSLRAADFQLVWGPPGTGKTRVIAEIVRRYRGSVLLAAPTNTAVDKMLLALVEAAPEVGFVRIGRAADSAELSHRLGERARSCFSRDLAAVATGARDMRRRLDEARVVAATAHRAAVDPYVRARRFDLAVVDEASQLNEPLTLGVVMRGVRFVLVGDDRQLPPIARDPELRVSMFERLKETALEKAPARVTLLDVQYRMHPEIMDVSNRLYYEGKLKSGVKEGERRPVGGAPVRFVAVDADVDGRSNPAEVSRVKDIVVELIDGGLAPDQIGVIAPFRAQVFLLREALDPLGVMADTVERFQGGEREAIVISLVRSRSSRFVLDDRRFNVAITRARSTLVFVGHPRLFDRTPHAWLSRREGDQDTRT